MPPGKYGANNLLQQTGAALRFFGVEAIMDVLMSVYLMEVGNQKQAIANKIAEERGLSTEAALNLLEGPLPILVFQGGGLAASSHQTLFERLGGKISVQATGMPAPDISRPRERHS